MAQDQMDSAGKRKQASNGEPAHGPPLQARVAAANRTVLTTNLRLRRSWRTWTWTGGGKAKLNGGKNVERGSGHGMAKASRQANTACRTRPLQATQPADGLPGTGLKEYNSQQLAGLSPCSPGKWRECGGAGPQKAGSDLPNLSVPHLSPLPVTVSTHSLNL